MIMLCTDTGGQVMVDVFISYSRTNKDKVAQIARGIEQAGYSVWWDAELPPHQSYGEVITGKIDDAKAAIVVWSAEAAASEWVRAEADMARNQKKLVQTALGDIMPPLPFNQIQYANLGDWNGEADHPEWRKVKQSLTALCGPREAGSVGAAAAGISAAPFVPAPTPAPSPALQAAPVTAAAFLGSAPPAKAGIMLSVPVMIGLGVAALGLVAAGAVVIKNQSALPQQQVAPVDPAGGNAVALMNAPQAAPAAPANPAVAPVAVPAPATAPQQAPQSVAMNRDVSLVNASGEVIMYLYWSNTNQQSWGEDRLGSGTLAAGQRWFVTIEDGSDACNFDIKAVTASGREIQHAAVNVCAVSEVTFN